MHRRTAWALILTLAAVGVYAQQNAGSRRGGDEAAGTHPPQTMKPLVRGAQYAVTALMPQASLAAERLLHDRGNAFDAIVAGQAVLGVVQPSANGRFAVPHQLSRDGRSVHPAGDGRPRIFSCSVLS